MGTCRFESIADCNERRCESPYILSTIELNLEGVLADVLLLKFAGEWLVFDKKSFADNLLVVIPLPASKVSMIDLNCFNERSVRRQRNIQCGFFWQLSLIWKSELWNKHRGKTMQRTCVEKIKIRLFPSCKVKHFNSDSFDAFCEPMEYVQASSCFVFIVLPINGDSKFNINGEFNRGFSF